MGHVSNSHDLLLKIPLAVLGIYLIANTVSLNIPFTNYAEIVSAQKNMIDLSRSQYLYCGKLQFDSKIKEDVQKGIAAVNRANLYLSRNQDALAVKELEPIANAQWDIKIAHEECEK